MEEGEAGQWLERSGSRCNDPVWHGTWRGAACVRNPEVVNELRCHQGRDLFARWSFAG